MKDPSDKRCKKSLATIDTNTMKVYKNAITLLSLKLPLKLVILRS